MIVQARQAEECKLQLRNPQHPCHRTGVKAATALFGFVQASLTQQRTHCVCDSLPYFDVMLNCPMDLMHALGNMCNVLLNGLLSTSHDMVPEALRLLHKEHAKQTLQAMHGPRDILTSSMMNCIDAPGYLNTHELLCFWRFVALFVVV